jgi:predicted nucleic-acid-binding Zn-ribbon protein
MAKMKCPRCHGHHITVLSNDVDMKSQTVLNVNPLQPFTIFKHRKREKLSAGKIGLVVMTGGLSLPVTGVRKKKHLDVFCNDCGHRWMSK